MPKKRQGKHSESELALMDGLEVYRLVLNGEIPKFPTRFWQRPEALDNAKKCTEYMIQELLKWDFEDVSNKIGNNTFEKHKLSGMLQTVFRYTKEGSIYNLVKLIYPDIKPWDLKRCSTDYWDEETSSKAIKWLFDEHLKFSIEDIKEKGNVKLIESHLGMALNPFGRNLFKALDYAYPETFKEWDFKLGNQAEFWNEEKAIKATKYLIEDKLGLSIEKDRRKITRLSRETFINAGFQTPMVKFGGIFKLIDMTYPNTFKRWEFPVPAGYWNEETISEAVKWLIVDVLKLKPTKENLGKVTKADFVNVGLSTLLSDYKKYGLFKRVFPEVYPDKNI